MTEMVTYERVGRAARIRMNDGRVNVMGPEMISQLHAAFDRAAAEKAMVLLSSRTAVFSAGFDLDILRGGDPAAAQAMVRQGGELALKVLSFPTPVITITTGDAYPMGSLLMLAADWRVGTNGSWKVGLNDVQIGLAMPTWCLEIARQRLLPAYFNRTAITGEMFTPDEAAKAGFLDDLTSGADLRDRVLNVVGRFDSMNAEAHAQTKLRARAGAIEAIRAAIDQDAAS